MGQEAGARRLICPQTLLGELIMQVGALLESMLGGSAAPSHRELYPSAGGKVHANMAVNLDLPMPLLPRSPARGMEETLKKAVGNRANDGSDVVYPQHVHVIQLQRSHSAC